MREFPVPRLRGLRRGPQLAQQPVVAIATQGAVKGRDGDVQLWPEAACSLACARSKRRLAPPAEILACGGRCCSAMVLPGRRRIWVSTSASTTCC